MGIDHFKGKWRWLWGTLVVLAVGGLAVVLVVFWPLSTSSAPAPRERQATPDLPRVPTVKVVRQDLKRTLELTGTVEGYETVDLYAKIGGYLDEIAVDIGDPIRKGQVLAKLSVPEMHKQLAQKQALVKQAEADKAQAEAAIGQAEAELARAEAFLDQVKIERGEKWAELQRREKDYKRYSDLIQKQAGAGELLDAALHQRDAAKAVFDAAEAKIRTAEATAKAARATRDKAKADYDSAQARVNVAQADLEYWQTLQEYATIRAPFDGVVTRRFVHPGAFIQSAEGNSGAKPLLTVTRTDRLRIFVSLPMDEVRWLDASDTAEIRVEGRPGEKFPAKVTRFSPALHEKSRMMLVELGLEKPDKRVLPGSYVYATLRLVDYPQTPVIPASALITDDQGKYVYVVKDGVCQRQSVTTLYEDGEKIGIASGLQGGEEIVSAGGRQFAGQQVVPVRRRLASKGR